MDVLLYPLDYLHVFVAMNRFRYIQSPIKAHLFVVSGNTSETNVTAPIPCVIGRGQDADLTIDHPTVSRRHCKIDVLNGRVVLYDLGSRNGTIKDENRLTRIHPVELENGGTFSVGPITFRIEYETKPSYTPHLSGVLQSALPSVISYSL